jgi:hypothetical protein
LDLQLPMQSLSAYDQCQDAVDAMLL